MVKTDSGSSQLSKEAVSIVFWEEIANFSVFILLSLLNITQCQAKLDQMCSEFQLRCKKSVILVVGLKMKALC